MNQFKKFVKRNFTGFAFFYRYLGKSILGAFVLSMAVSFMDGMGLSMFFPLLKIVSGSQNLADSADMENLAYVVSGIESLGIPMTLATVLLFMVIFFSLKGIAKYCQSIYLVILQQSFIRDIRIRSLNLLNNIKFKAFITSDIGRIQNTMTTEVERSQQSFKSYFESLQHGTMVFIYMGFAFFLDAQFAILVCIGGGLTTLFYRVLYKYTKAASRKLSNHNSIYQGKVIQHIGNFKYLKASGRVHEYATQLADIIRQVESARRQIGFLASIASAAREPMMVAVVALVIFAQVTLLDGAIGAIIISLLFFYRALTSLTQMQMQWNRYIENSGSLENLKNFQIELRKEQEVIGKHTLDNFKQSIDLIDLSFYFGSTLILDDINLNIKKNESIALVGESGSGKSTLVNLLTGLLPPDYGKITIDGIEFKDLDKESYQKRIGYVSQDSVIFNDTIYNNVTFWAPKNQANLQRFQKAMDQASLNDFFMNLAYGEDTELGNNGINLSGGQKQRISIARELYKDIDILILDEATSALDSETEKEIQKSVENLQGEYTLIMIAHRLSTIRHADSIVYMEKGRIIDQGNFSELQTRQDRFRKMVELQEL